MFARQANVQLSETQCTRQEIKGCNLIDVPYLQLGWSECIFEYTFV